MPRLRNGLLIAALLICVATAARGAPLDEADKLREWGREAHWNGDFNVAIRCLTEAIRLRAGFAMAYYDRALAYAKKRDFDKAVADYTEAIRLKPDLAEAYWGRGNVFEKQRDHLRAIGDYDRAIRLKPDLAGAYESRGNAYDNKGDHDRAIVDYDEAIRLNPYLVGAYCNRGVTYGRKGDLDRAVTDYGEAIRLEPDYADAYSHRGKGYDEKGDHERAAADYAEAARLKPDHTVTHTAPLSYSSYIVVRFVPWLLAACLVILVVAAFLHWKRTRHWCLLTLGLGALLAVAGIIAGQIIPMLMLLCLHAAESVETIRLYTNMSMIWSALSALGAAVALVGGIGAIHWAMKLRRQGELPTTPAL